MQQAKFLWISGLVCTFAAGYWTRGVVSEPEPPDTAVRESSAVAPTRPTAAGGDSGTTESLQMSQQDPASSLDPSGVPAVTPSESNNATRAETLGEFFLNNASRRNQRAVSYAERSLADFFELYGIDDARAEQMIEELVTLRREQTMAWIRQERDGNGPTLNSAEQQAAFAEIEREVFGEYYDAYQSYKPKENIYAQILAFSDVLDQPLPISTRQQLADIIYDAQTQQALNAGQTAAPQGFVRSQPNINTMRDGLQRAIERHDMILDQTERLLTRSQQQAFEERLARQREMTELSIRMMELRQENAGNLQP
ncbi:MAG: hypothetical protein AAGJ86_11255 [Pseudomonadota bacterium]